jgi:N-acetylglucosaminyldiphosphoundecaprenol N-acetyl-beta-D-mannosaminyltransferase
MEGTQEIDISVFGVTVNDLSLDATLATIEQTLEHGNSSWIATVNPEILLHARTHGDYRTLLSRAALRLPDGVGLNYMTRIRNRVTGVQLTSRMLELAAAQGYPVLCITWKYGRSTAAQIVQGLEHTIHPDLISVVEINDRAHVSEDEWQTIAELQQEFGPRMIFCGIGFPYQEEVLQELLKRSSQQLQPTLSTWIGIGNGGALDYLAGTQKNPPPVLRRLGFEWLWRLVTQPQRWKKILTAVIIFPFAVVWDRVTKRKRPS